MTSKSDLDGGIEGDAAARESHFGRHASPDRCDGECEAYLVVEGLSGLGIENWHCSIVDLPEPIERLEELFQRHADLEHEGVHGDRNSARAMASLSSDAIAAIADGPTGLSIWIVAAAAVPPGEHPPTWLQKSLSRPDRPAADIIIGPDGLGDGRDLALRVSALARMPGASTATTRSAAR